MLAAADELHELGAQESADALADGDVTYDEYLEAARRYQACLRDVGVVIEGPHLSPVDNVWLLWQLPEEISGGESVAAAVSSCDERWRPVAAAYIDTHEQRMDDGLQAAVVTCMAAAGYDLSGDESQVIDFMGEIESPPTPRMQDAERCIVELSQRLFPELPGVTVAY
ncbi:hypothetical protein [Microbacterium sp. NPDC058389]|uniref:hypothetical protein n=1 Tax=Microbacterium sp. NPDC058389 TaxID=3346475 RepID=UPI00364DE90B